MNDEIFQIYRTNRKLIEMSEVSTDGLSEEQLRLIPDMKLNQAIMDELMPCYAEEYARNG